MKIGDTVTPKRGRGGPWIIQSFGSQPSLLGDSDIEVAIFDGGRFMAVNKLRLVNIKRDPKTDPKPGDIFRFGGTYGSTFIEILDSSGACLAPNDVAYVSDGVESAMSIGPYREWVADAEVIRAVA